MPAPKASSKHTAQQKKQTERLAKKEVAEGMPRDKAERHAQAVLDTNTAALPKVRRGADKVAARENGRGRTKAVKSRTDAEKQASAAKKPGLAKKPGTKRIRSDVGKTQS